MASGTRDASAAPALGGDGRTVVVRALTYGPADTYSTSWSYGCLTGSLRSGDVIPVCINHDRSRIVGKVVDFRDHDDGLDLTLRLADPDAVPDARMAQSLLRDKMIPGVSIGFTDGVSRPDPRQRGVRQFMRATLVEISFVVTPSVPGARVLAMRSSEIDGIRTAAALQDLDRRAARGSRLDAEAAKALRRLNDILWRS